MLCKHELIYAPNHLVGPHFTDVDAEVQRFHDVSREMEDRTVSEQSQDANPECQSRECSGTRGRGTSPTGQRVLLEVITSLQEHRMPSSALVVATGCCSDSDEGSEEFAPRSNDAAVILYYTHISVLSWRKLNSAPFS